MLLCNPASNNRAGKMICIPAKGASAITATDMAKSKISLDMFDIFMA
jgi:hypothetical protein